MSPRDLYHTALAGLKLPSRPNVTVCMKRLAEIAAEGSSRSDIAATYLRRLYDLQLS